MREFVEITIAGLNEDESHPTGQGAFWTYTLKLSSTAPAAWCDIFNREWRDHFYMMKRTASASGKSIFVTCPESELQGLIDQFKIVLSKTNATFRQMLEANAAEEEQRKAKYEEDRKKVRDLGGKLKF